MKLIAEKHKGYFWGAILVLAGVLILLQNLGILYLEDFFETWWPVILILVGLKIILDRRERGAADA